MTQTTPEIVPQRRGVNENIATIKSSLGEIAQTEREKVLETYQHGKERVQGLQVRFEEYVRERPVRSLCLAAGAGALLGLLLARRR